MRFAHPEAFLLLVLVPFLFLLFWTGRRQKEAFLRSFGDASLLQQTPVRFPALHKEWVRSTLLLLLFLSTIVALADPRLPSGAPHLRAGTLDVVMLIDVSKSMAAEDYGTLSRLGKAVEIARGLLGDLHENRVGIVTFAGTGFHQAELTEDLRVLDFILKHWVKVDAVRVGGSNVTQGIEMSIDLFPKEDRGREKLILLFSDGGEEEEENRQAVLTTAAHRGIKIIALGLGTLHPSKIPLYDAHKKFLGYLKVNEQIVTTRLHEETLQQIATTTGGLYRRITHDETWHNLLTQPAVVGNTLNGEERKLFQLFLLFGLLSFAFHTLQRLRRSDVV
jgi:Ca-activated chloride channel family protein